MKRIFTWLLLFSLLLTALPYSALAAQSTVSQTTKDIQPAQADAQEDTTQAASSAKLIAITFDDGPGKDTARLLDGLKTRGVKVTFFMQGCNAERYPNTVQRVYDEGHEVASHTYNHPTLSTQSVSQIRWQLDKTAEILDKACGAGTKYNLRPPYGDYNQTVLNNIHCPAVIWSIDPVDWRDRNADTVCSRIVEKAFDGAIVLVHDIHSTSVDGALKAIDKLKAQGYEFVTVSELYRRRGVAMKDGELHYSCKPKSVSLPAVSAPTIQTTPVTGGIRVTISSKDGAPIYYSLDGSEPARTKQRYTGSFTVSVDCTVKALAAFRLNGGRSETVSSRIRMAAAVEPRLTLGNGFLRFDAVPNGSVYYTTDGTLPTTNSTAYTKPIPYYEGMLRYRAIGTGYIGSTYTMYLTKRGNLFRDLPQSKWYYDFCDRAYTLGLFAGTGNYRFAPETKVTRGMFVTLLYKLSGDCYEGGGSGFTDVPTGRYYATAVAWAYANGIASGVSAGRFDPDGVITREQMCVMLQSFLRYEKKTPRRITVPNFSDAMLISSWAAEAVDEIAGYGFLCGVGDNCFLPRGVVSRAEAATVLLRLYDFLND